MSRREENKIKRRAGILKASRKLFSRGIKNNKALATTPIRSPQADIGKESGRGEIWTVGKPKDW